MLSFRPSTEKDRDMWWAWRNEPTTRRASFDNHYISDTENNLWFSAALAKKDTELLNIVLGDMLNIGWVILDYESDKAEIKMGLDRNYRGKGHGQQAIKQAAEHAIQSRGVKSVFCHVKIDNYKALFAFDKAGFRDVGEGKSNGVEYVRLIYP